MGSTSRVWLGAAAVVVGLGLAASTWTPLPALRAQGTCPDGQDRWQCVHECPSGTLYDGPSGTCVTPPGVPPPALTQTPQIPQFPQF